MIPAAAINREDAAWLAGIVDGEGCLDSPRGNPRVRVKMSDLDVVLRVSDVMGGSTHMEHDPRPDRKPLMVAQVTGERAVAVMRALLPWLGSRRTAKATDIITAHAARKSGRVRLLRVEEAA